MWIVKIQLQYNYVLILMAFVENGLQTDEKSCPELWKLSNRITQDYRQEKITS